MHRFDRFARLRAARDVGLIRDDDQAEAGIAQLVQRIGNSVQHFQILDVIGRMRLSIAHDGAIDDAVAIEKHGFHHLVDSHFVSAAFSAGCDTSRCHTTA